MPVDISNVLHVLAHELRTPAGIAQGYLRMLLDDRLSDPADRRRAIEAAQKALARVAELTHESSRLAQWCERSGEARPVVIADARALVTGAVEKTQLDPPPLLSIELPAPAPIASTDQAALEQAFAAVVSATARELRKKPCAVTLRRNDGTVDVLIGEEEHFDRMAAGPDGPEARPLGLERGGVGLSLITATAVLEDHAAQQWTVEDLRTTVGIRLPLTERAQL